MKIKSIWMIIFILWFIFMVSACVQQTAEAPLESAKGESETSAEEEKKNTSDEAAELVSRASGGNCPAVTLADRKGVQAGKYERFYELEDYEAAAGCEVKFRENPDIAELNSRITNNPDLPSVEDRIPEEPYVVVPYEKIGKYGGELSGLTNSTEAGTGEFLSIRHVNLIRYSDDFKTIEPNIAKSWEWNDDFTEFTFQLRKGHKWSDGEPFTAYDVEFWLNDLILNPEVYPNVPSWAVFGDDTLKVEVMDDTTFRFLLPVPTPGLLNFFATEYNQPWQPKHFFEKKMAGGMSLPEVAELYYGNSDWKDVPSPLLNGEADDVLPTLESHILVEETTEGRHFVANPYYYVVDTVGKQLPYVSEMDELYVPNSEVRNLKITNGEVDIKSQTLNIIDYPLYKENEEQGNYTVKLSIGIGQMVFYSFNLNHPDEELSKIFNDLRFRQAMSLAINRDEIVNLVYLGQATPMQLTPADPNTVDFVTEEHKTAFIEYDPQRANALLDEMGLVDVDGDGFRDRLDGENLTLDLQFVSEGGPPAIHELVKDYWEDIGIAVRTKEVTADEYRQRGNANQADVLTWKQDNVSGSTILLNTVMILPPFGDEWNPGFAIRWAEWVNSDGASGTEPPEDVLELYDIVAEFKKHELGSPESSEFGERITDIFVDNLWKIGIAGDVLVPVIYKNTIHNMGPYKIAIGDYRYTNPMIPAQWYFDE